MRGASAGRIGAGLIALLFAAKALAQTAGPTPTPDHMPPQSAMSGSEMSERAARRFPQPVRVGTLIGRRLLGPVEAQPVLGRVTGLVRRGDGATEMVIRLDGRLGLIWLGLPWIEWSGFGSRLVGVPADAVALLGEHVALMDLTAERLQALPTFVPDAAPTIGPDDTIRIGVVQPFH